MYLSGSALSKVPFSAAASLALPINMTIQEECCRYKLFRRSLFIDATV